ncbi:MAG: insulinase family protein [Myxococcales bacterium]|nr:insulinase family protein [Myxococcales bacterium]
MRTLAPRRPALRVAALATLALTLLGGCPPKGETTPPDGSKGAGQGAGPVDVAAVLAASDLPATLDAPLADDPMGVTIHRLKNGLTVYISTDRQEPAFTAWIAVRTGSRNDPADSTGLAHYLEHMLFKGTEQMGTLDHAAEAPHVDRIAALYDDLRGTQDAQKRQAIFAEIDRETQETAKSAIPNEFDRLYAELGITEVNAFTSDDETVYVAKVPRNRFHQWAEVEADRFQHPVFRLFYPELEAVYEEKNISLDDPEERVWEATRRLLFPRHPYGTQPTIGITEHLKTPAYGDMVAYFGRWYAPNNVAIILAGDIDPATALPVLEEAFGGWQPRALEAPAAAELPPVKGRAFKEIVAEGEQTVWVAWPTVDVNHPDEPALTVMDMLVDNAASGLLNVELVLTQKVPAAASLSEMLHEAGYWGLTATAREGQAHQEVEGLLLGVVDRLRRGEFTQEDIDAIVLHHEIEDKRRLESSNGRVYAIMSAYINRTPWERAARHTQRLRAVKRDDVIRVATKYLGEDRAVVWRRHGEHQPPAIPKPKITPVPLDASRSSKFAEAILAQPTAPIDPLWLREGEHYRHLELPAGPMIWVPNPRNDLFSVTYRYEVGERRRPLLCHALDLLDLSGAGDMDAAALQRRLFQLGTTVESRCDDEGASITIDGIDANLEASVRLVESWLRTPAFTDETVRSLLANTLSQRKDALEDPDFLAYAIAQFASRAGQSPLLAAPSNKALGQAKGVALARELRELPDLGHTTLYFGGRDPAAAGAAVALGKGHRKLAQRPPIKYREVKRATLYFAHKEMAQARVQIVAPQPPLDREVRATANLFSQLLGKDMSGLIFQEIREARGLAYSAYAYVAAGETARDPGLLRGYLGTQADKTIDALALMLDLLRHTPVADERFAAARNALVEDTRADYILPRRRPAAVYGWDRRGDAGDPRPFELERIGATEAAAIREYAGRFADAPLIISVLGDRTRVDLDRLRDFATVEEVPIDALVSFGAFPAGDGSAKAATKPAK